jgi:hypothetical protein
MRMGMGMGVVVKIPRLGAAVFAGGEGDHLAPSPVGVIGAVPGQVEDGSQDSPGHEDRDLRSGEMGPRDHLLAVYAISPSSGFAGRPQPGHGFNVDFLVKIPLP